MSELLVKPIDVATPLASGVSPDAGHLLFGIPDSYRATSRTTSWVANNLRAVLASLMRFADALIIVVAAVIAYLIRNNDIDQVEVYLIDVTLNVLLTAIYFQHVGLI